MTDSPGDRPSGGSSDDDSFERPADDDGPAGNAVPPSERIPDSGSSRDTPDDYGGGVLGWFQWFRSVDSGPILYVRDLLTSMLIVLLIGGVLFALSGVWPPMVAIESGSMEPNMSEGDLVFIVDNERLVPDSAVTNDGDPTGVVPADVAEREDRTKFSGHGDVIVFRPNGNTGDTPVIHRAMLWVDDGEDWYDRADPDALGGADDCGELDHCPAPHAGFITQGDNEFSNANYDQVTRLSSPVRPEWIVGTAELRVPYLGHVRLIFSGVTVAPTEPTPALASASDPPGFSSSVNATDGAEPA